MRYEFPAILWHIEQVFLKAWNGTTLYSLSLSLSDLSLSFSPVEKSTSNSMQSCALYAPKWNIVHSTCFQVIQPGSSHESSSIEVLGPRKRRADIYLSIYGYICGYHVSLDRSFKLQALRFADSVPCPAPSRRYATISINGRFWIP